MKFTNKKLLTNGDLKTKVAVHRALIELTRGLSPISATGGGWFTSAMVAAKAGVEESTARNRLTELMAEHRVEMRRSPPGRHSNGKNLHVVFWRIR